MKKVFLLHNLFLQSLNVMNTIFTVQFADLDLVVEICIIIFRSYVS